jgi:hypothetical protein
MALPHVGEETKRTINQRSRGRSMSRLCIAVCFFVGGYSFAAIGLQSSEQKISDEHRPVFTRYHSISTAVPVVIRGGIPVVPDIVKTPIFDQMEVSAGGVQALDSLDCRNCSFEDATLTYGGGAFNLVGLKTSGTTTVKLTGAAANTYAFLKFMEQIGKGVEGTGANFPISRPIERKTVTKKPMTKMTVTAPFIGPGQ